jgi:hypothetical protein
MRGFWGQLDSSVVLLLHWTEKRIEPYCLPDRSAQVTKTGFNSIDLSGKSIFVVQTWAAIIWPIDIRFREKPPAFENFLRKLVAPLYQWVTTNAACD